MLVVKPSQALRYYQCPLEWLLVKPKVYFQPSSQSQWPRVDCNIEKNQSFGPWGGVLFMWKHLNFTRMDCWSGLPHDSTALPLQNSVQIDTQRNHRSGAAFVAKKPMIRWIVGVGGPWESASFGANWLVFYSRIEESWDLQGLSWTVQEQKMILWTDSWTR